MYGFSTIWRKMYGFGFFLSFFFFASLLVCAFRTTKEGEKEMILF